MACGEPLDTHCDAQFSSVPHCCWWWSVRSRHMSSSSFSRALEATSPSHDETRRVHDDKPPEPASNVTGPSRPIRTSHLPFPAQLRKSPIERLQAASQDLLSRLVFRHAQTLPTMFSGLGNPRQIAAQVMNFALVLSTAFMVR